MIIFVCINNVKLETEIKNQHYLLYSKNMKFLGYKNEKKHVNNLYPKNYETPTK